MNKKIKSPENYNLLDPDVIESPYEAYKVYREDAQYIIVKIRVFMLSLNMMI